MWGDGTFKEFHFPILGLWKFGFLRHIIVYFRVKYFKRKRELEDSPPHILRSNDLSAFLPDDGFILVCRAYQNGGGYAFNLTH